MKTVNETVSTKNSAGRLFFLEASDGGKILSETPMARTEKSLLPAAEFRMASSSMLRPDNLLDQHGRSEPERRLDRTRGSGRSRIAKRLSPKARHSRQSNSISKRRAGKLYWCDREGMRVMRANLDGSKIETLVDTSKGDARPGTDQTKWCVGIAVDPESRTNLLDAKRPRRCGARVAFFAQISTSRRARRRPIAPTSNTVRRLAGTDRSRARSEESPHLLDRPRRSAARQHSESRVNRRGFQQTPDARNFASLI